MDEVLYQFLKNELEKVGIRVYILYHHKLTPEISDIGEVRFEYKDGQHYWIEVYKLRLNTLTKDVKKESNVDVYTEADENWNDLMGKITMAIRKFKIESVING